jgi:hypothetical protein
MNISAWLIENKEFLGVIALLVVSLLKSTAWGKANAKGLDVVVAAIEKHGSAEVKAAVRSSAADHDVKEAIDDAVSVADDKKVSVKPSQIIAREAMKALGLKRRRKS